ncbi:putative phosphoprotein phosphatase [Corchorus olitorius]|uniref:Phosphoprotein phosphatase n=1 Tax=Corchorus olitorius TaxID=93759 RepID=A0A1R3JW89_9ROSI|nr:putative phosphoprotein phosphatase [Corchorus olitorius]
MVFPCLEKLRLSAIKNVERIWHPQLISSEKLTSLIIEGCGKLKYVLSTSMAKSLVKIKYFDIVDCKFLEKIIFSEEGDITEEEIEFPQLDSLKMKNLENLRGFCSQDHKINFPSLTILEIDHCPKLKGFIEDNRRLTPQAFFDEKVGFPSLQKLSIGSLTNVEMLWHNQLSENSFCKLREMSVQYCKELATVIIPCDMWSTLKRLETLRVLYCGSLEEIFEFPRQGVATELRELLVWSLPKLKQVWSKDPGGSSSAFENLHSVEVWDCWSLQNVFPASVARVLPQLKHLDIDQCGVEEIVSKDIEGSDTAITFMFDQLSILELRQLTKLKCFYPGLHTITCPRLKKLKAWRCNQVRIFGTELNDYADDRQPQESLFLIEQSTSTFAELEEVCLTSEEIAIICKKFPEVCFPEGKVLAVSSYHDENSAIFLISFLEKFNNLEKLEFVGCNFREPFGFGEEMNAGIQLPFKSLKLDNLNHIESIWNDQESRLDHFLPNLETLEVSGCYDLKCLGSSPAPFKNLVTLEVTHCCKMINLVESSTAIQSLEQLKNLKIRSCFKLEKIVGNEGCHESEDRIIFKSLKCLELKDLPNLVCFCRGTNTFEFPLLEQVVVMRCPELKIFCTGVVEAPLLERVLATDEDEDRKGHWDGDLKTTVEQLYTNKVGLNEKISDLELSDLHKSMEFWRDNLQGKLNFRQLLALEVHDCGSLKSIFTISMARSLVQLIKIEVRNCPMMEQIITKEGAEEETVVLPCLMTITLESCSSLTSFFLGSNTLECFSLQGIRIIDCPKMFEFASESPRNQDMETNGRVDAPFFNDKVRLFSFCIYIYTSLCHMVRM